MRSPRTFTATIWSTLASFGSIRAVSTNAAVGVSAAKVVTVKGDEGDFESGARARGTCREDAQEERVRRHSAQPKISEIKPIGQMLVPSQQGLTNDVTGSHTDHAQAQDPCRRRHRRRGHRFGHRAGRRLRRSHHRLLRFHAAADIRAVTPHDDYGHGTHVAGPDRQRIRRRRAVRAPDRPQGARRTRGRARPTTSFARSSSRSPTATCSASTS